MSKLICLLFLVSSSFLPVSACLNDSEIQAYEEEFESEYLQGVNGSAGIEIAPNGIARADAGDSSMIAIASTGASILGILFILVLAVKMDLRAHTHKKE